MRHHKTIYSDWGFGSVDPMGRNMILNFYGPPGTGKTLAAEALAGTLGLPYIHLGIAELESKFVGETAKNISGAFTAAATEGALLFFDEADTLLGACLAEEKRKQQELFECITQASVHIIEGVETALVDAGQRQQKLAGVINHTITRMQGEINASLTQIQETSLISSNALTGFTQGTQQIVQQMADAAKEMVEGSNQVSLAAKGLENVVDEFGSEFKEVLDKVRKDLGSAIETMSERSSATMKEGSEKLNSATKEISSALSELSEDVKDTMNKVEASIGTALDLQKKASIEFTNSTQTLNENIETTTQMTEQLGKDITSGMSSVAEVGQRMVGIGKNLDSIGKRLENQVPILESISNREDSDIRQEVVQKISSIEILLQGLMRQSAANEATT
ncbi:AAA family ATPase [Chromobacterium sphagni]|uniref:AAA family ATPase n=1 Tax=Chromobacterium sphagni TaxID=1903179 RepID=UPI0019582AD0|nr:AAA family ATPase [Chromobacterium sphagni]